MYLSFDTGGMPACWYIQYGGNISRRPQRALQLTSRSVKRVSPPSSTVSDTRGRPCNGSTCRRSNRNGSGSLHRRQRVALHDEIGGQGGRGYRQAEADVGVVAIEVPIDLAEEKPFHRRIGVAAQIEFGPSTAIQSRPNAAAVDDLGGASSVRIRKSASRRIRRARLVVPTDVVGQGPPRKRLFRLHSPNHP